MKVKYRVLGLMSGTSLDGVDLALCLFFKNGEKWSFSIEEAKTVTYSRRWREKLATAHLLNGRDLIELNNHYGRWLGKLCTDFLSDKKKGKPDFISSHGHTIFHQPDAGFTFQLGDGTALSAASGVPVICDFRSLDVQYGGQGAPLVPIGDRLLFHQYDACVNLGGIANISFEDRNRKRLAWDICFVNMGLNLLASKISRRYDAGGRTARSGKTDIKLFEDLLGLAKKIKGKKPSLAREQFEKFVQPLLSENRGVKNLPDLMCTFTEYAAQSIASAIGVAKAKKVLLTGGGAHNDFLVERIRKISGPDVKIECGSKQIIDFKEALIFAFLGVLKKEGIDNSLSSVTGAVRDSSGGVMIGF